MRYRERLWVPWWWWPVVAACLAILGAELHGGLGWLAALYVYLVLGIVAGACLWAWGAVRVQVSTDELRAGTARLPLRHVGRVRALDAATARRLRGPEADPAAHMLLRPYLATAVFVEVTDPTDPTPYWLVTTRDPQRLAATLAAGRPETSTPA